MHKDKQLRLLSVCILWTTSLRLPNTCRILLLKRPRFCSFVLSSSCHTTESALVVVPPIYTLQDGPTTKHDGRTGEEGRRRLLGWWRRGGGLGRRRRGGGARGECGQRR
ncbi:hypothetical protein R3P38DRAFT_3017262 [Favolaschia claudopus]|uniref:Secreted protein n=1 Tax=Favolaschia claudopus TaxID=2862362 RepID=A0AAW0AI08_9AGAR